MVLTTLSTIWGQCHNWVWISGRPSLGDPLWVRRMKQQKRLKNPITIERLSIASINEQHISLSVVYLFPAPGVFCMSESASVSWPWRLGNVWCKRSQKRASQCCNHSPIQICSWWLHLLSSDWWEKTGLSAQDATEKENLWVNVMNHFDPETWIHGLCPTLLVKFRHCSSCAEIVGIVLKVNYLKTSQSFSDLKKIQTSIFTKIICCKSNLNMSFLNIFWLKIFHLIPSVSKCESYCNIIDNLFLTFSILHIFSLIRFLISNTFSNMKTLRSDSRVSALPQRWEEFM